MTTVAPPHRARSLARRIASAVGAAATALGVRDDAGEVARDVLGLVEEPLDLYARHPVWPSLLTQGNLPVELSLKLDGAGEAAIRCVADVTDYGATPARNWNRYLHHAAAIAGRQQDDSELWQLCQLHLNGMPATFPSRMMHGHAYTNASTRRGSLYFATGWLRPEQLRNRLPRETAALAGVARVYGTPVTTQVEVIGYDLDDAEVVQAKAYTALGVRDGASFAQLVGSHPDLRPARDLFEAFREDADASRHPRSLLLQTALDDNEPRQRLFFFCSAWGWSTPGGLERLLTFLDASLGVDLGPLTVFSESTALHDVATRLSMAAVGADDGRTSVTFYFRPVAPSGLGAHAAVRTPAARKASASDPRTTLGKAVEYVMRAREADGSWSDYDVDPPDADGFGYPTQCFVTAYTASMVTLDAAPMPELATTFGWLQSRYGAALGWGRSEHVKVDAETTALAIEALARSPLSLPDDAGAALLGPGSLGDRDGAFFGVHTGAEPGPPDVAAAVLSALLLAGSGNADARHVLVLALAAAQRPDGGWDSYWWPWSLLGTWRALRALRVCAEAELHVGSSSAGARAAAAGAVRRALPYLSSTAVAREPFALAAWLGSWAAAGGDVRDPRVSRALAALAETQQDDGRWLAAPTRRLVRVPADSIGAPRDAELYADGRCVVTTATAIGALQAFLTASRARSAAA
jgi:hypothetical protein